MNDKNTLEEVQRSDARYVKGIYVTARFKIRGPFQNGLARFKMGQPVLKWATG